MAALIIILGMHRSGTSAVTGVLSKLGGQAPKHLLPANQDNPRGYFESEPLRHLHDELLASSGSAWNDWRPFDPSWYETSAAQAFRHRAIRLIDKEFAAAPYPLIKDPRICRFVPFWLETLKLSNTVPRFVIPVRSPLDVAMSLKRRNGISLCEGLLLWMRHVLDAEFQTRGEKRTIFALDQFMTDWQTVIGKLAQDLALDWPKPNARAVSDVESFLERDLLHYKSSQLEVSTHTEMHDWVVAVYEALLGLAHGTSPVAAIFERLDEIRAAFDRSTTLFAPALTHSRRELDDAREELLRVQKEHELLLERLRVADTACTERGNTLGGTGPMRKTLDSALFWQRYKRQ